MSSYKTRVAYYRMIAEKNNLIAHGRAIDSGGTRKSFHRISGEEEFDAACVNWAHFPCVAHIGYGMQFKQLPTGKPREIKATHLQFYDRAADSSADAIETAYDNANRAMKQFLSYMVEDILANGNCGELFLFDLNNARAQMLEVTNGNLYGWEVLFQDEVICYELVYNASLWSDAGASAPGGGITTSNDYEVVYFNNVADLEIAWDSTRQKRFGYFPIIEVWLTVDGISKANIPINVDAQPPNATLFTISFGGAVSGFVIIK